MSEVKEKFNVKVEEKLNIKVEDDSDSDKEYTSNRARIKSFHHFMTIKSSAQATINNSASFSSEKNLLFDPEILQLLVYFYVT